jgi:hypothetical protein
MSRHWKIIIALAGLFLLIASSAVVSLRIQPGSELENYQQLLRQRGEKLTLAELLPPPATAEDNSADLFQTAAGLFNTGIDNYAAMQMVGPGRAAVCWRQADVRSSDFTNTWEQYRAEVEADRPAVEVLHQILERPRLDFQLDYAQGASLRISHLAAMKRAAQKLEAAVQLDLHDGQPGAASTNLLTMLAMVQRDYRDDLLIGHLVRVAITAVAISPTWEFLQATNATDAQLAAVQKSWQQLNFLKDAENVFAMERDWCSTEIEQYRSSHENFKQLSSGFMAARSGSGGGSDWDSITIGARLVVAEGMWRSSWSYSQELQTIQRCQMILETLRAMQTNDSQFYKADYDAMAARLSALGGTNLNGAVFRALQVPDFQDYFGGASWGATLRKTLQIETARRVVVTAAALKRFQLKHGKLPETLGELAPEFLPSAPIDPFDGKPLKYHPGEDGVFLLYSVGEDGTDDGGDAGSTSSANWYWLRARDWVWPQPATPAEAQFLYDHPPRR